MSKIAKFFQMSVAKFFRVVVRWLADSAQPRRELMAATPVFLAAKTHQNSESLTRSSLTPPEGSRLLCGCPACREMLSTMGISLTLIGEPGEPAVTSPLLRIAGAAINRAPFKSSEDTMPRAPREGVLEFRLGIMAAEKWRKRWEIARALLRLYDQEKRWLERKQRGRRF